ncbi:MAG: hypothetical protein IPN36_02220 [Bacteroidetes bacterium]|nr:hypothetical protein [Bacteroidota bacterium]
MNLEDLWKQNENTSGEITELLKNSRWKKGGHDYPLKKIKKNLLYFMPTAVVSSFAYLYVIIEYPLWPSQIGLSILILFNCWSLYDTYKIYRSIPEHLVTESNLLGTLSVSYTTIKKWIRISELTGVFTYPIALTSGFLLGGWVGSGLPVEQFMSLPYVVIAYALSIAFMTPLCFIITRLLFRIFYGRYLKQIEKNIRELKNE